MNFVSDFHLIKGTTVVLHVTTQTGTDPFGASVYSDTTVEVENVLIQPADGVNSSVITKEQLEGRHLQYTLHIPKTDTHCWDNAIVEFYGKRWKTYGAERYYDPDNTPGPYNKQIKVEAYE